MLPIVLAPGYFGFAQIGPLTYFRNVAPVFQQLGAEVYAIEVAPKGSLEQRSAQLAAQITTHFPNTKVHVIAHSMGGMDARYLIQKGNGRDLIASVTALGSPFRGTMAADVAVNPAKLMQIGVANVIASAVRFGVRSVVRIPDAGFPQAAFALGAFQNALGQIPSGNYAAAGEYFKKLFSFEDEALPELTTESCARLFPPDESDLGGVPFSSYAGDVGATLPSPFFSPSTIVLDAAGQPNDGIVPVQSAILKDHRGTLPVDHIGLVGWGPKDMTATFREIYARLPRS